MWELTESCALDVAEQGAQPVERTSSLMNVTRERIRQIESLALGRLSTLRDVRALRDLPEPVPRRARWAHEYRARASARCAGSAMYGKSRQLMTRPSTWYKGLLRTTS